MSRLSSLAGSEGPICPYPCIHLPLPLGETRIPESDILTISGYQASIIDLGTLMSDSQDRNRISFQALPKIRIGE